MDRRSALCGIHVGVIEGYVFTTQKRRALSHTVSVDTRGQSECFVRSVPTNILHVRKPRFTPLPQVSASGAT